MILGDSMNLTYKEYDVLIMDMYKKIDINKQDNSFMKRKKIYDFMINNIKYDYLALYNLKFKNLRQKRELEIQDVLIFNKGICNSLAVVYKLLLEKAGIYSMCVCVKNHMFNLVQNENNTFSFDDVTKGIMAVDFKNNTVSVKDKVFIELIRPKGTVGSYFDYSLKEAEFFGQGKESFKHRYLNKDLYWLPMSTIDYVYKLIKKRDFEYLKIKNDLIRDYFYKVNLPDEKLIQSYNQ